MQEFHRALADIKGRAQYNDRLAEKFREIDDLAKSEFERVLKQMGQEDYELKAELLLSALI